MIKLNGYDSSRRVSNTREMIRAELKEGPVRRKGCDCNTSDKELVVEGDKASQNVAKSPRQPPRSPDATARIREDGYPCLSEDGNRQKDGTRKGTSTRSTEIHEDGSSGNGTRGNTGHVGQAEQTRNNTASVHPRHGPVKFTGGQ